MSREFPYPTEIKTSTGRVVMAPGGLREYIDLTLLEVLWPHFLEIHFRILDCARRPLSPWLCGNTMEQLGLLIQDEIDPKLGFIILAGVKREDGSKVLFSIESNDSVTDAAFDGIEPTEFYSNIAERIFKTACLVSSQHVVAPSALPFPMRNPGALPEGF